METAVEKLEAMVSIIYSCHIYFFNEQGIEERLPFSLTLLFFLTMCRNIHIASLNAYVSNEI